MPLSLADMLSAADELDKEDGAASSSNDTFQKQIEWLNTQEEDIDDLNNLAPSSDADEQDVAAVMPASPRRVSRLRRLPSSPGRSGIFKRTGEALWALPGSPRGLRSALSPFARRAATTPASPRPAKPACRSAPASPRPAGPAVRSAAASPLCERERDAAPQPTRPRALGRRESFARTRTSPRPTASPDNTRILELSTSARDCHAGEAAPVGTPAHDVFEAGLPIDLSDVA